MWVWTAHELDGEHVIGNLKRMLSPTGILKENPRPKLSLKEAENIGKTNAEMAVDQAPSSRGRSDFDSLDQSVGSYWQNTTDTILEALGSARHPLWRSRSDAADKAFIETLNRLGVQLDDSGYRWVWKK